MLSTLMKRTENFDKISGQIAALETKFEEKFSATSNAIHKMQSQIFELEKAASYNEKSVRDIKSQTEYLLAKDTSHSKEVSTLHTDMRQLRTDLQSERISRNQLDQYHRSALNVIIAGVPQVDDDESIQVVVTQICGHFHQLRPRRRRSTPPSRSLCSRIQPTPSPLHHHPVQNQSSARPLLLPTQTAF